VTDLAFHGDAELAPGLADLAVNVRAGAPPEWLRDVLREAVADVAAYPDTRAAHEAVGARHGRPAAEVLLTAGAAEAFTLLARAVPGERIAVVHPQFTEPEAAMLAAGRPVRRVVLPEPFTLAGAPVPDDADVVLVGNPTNPTSVLHPAAEVAALARPGRTLVVDEAFMDAVPGEPESLAARRDVPGLLVVRSLTKTWGLAGIRAGYVLGDAAALAALRAAQPPWVVSSPAAAAAVACSRPDAVAEAAEWARGVGDDRDHLLARLAAHAPDVAAAPHPRAPFVLLKLPAGADGGAVRAALREAGWAVRRGDTFPGLGPAWLRVAVRSRETSAAFADALGTVLSAAVLVPPTDPHRESAR
jgi:histidinol-phosphate aminotransferase